MRAMHMARPSRDRVLWGETAASSSQLSKTHAQNNQGALTKPTAHINNIPREFVQKLTGLLTLILLKRTKVKLCIPVAWSVGKL